MVRRFHPERWPILSRKARVSAPIGHMVGVQSIPLWSLHVTVGTSTEVSLPRSPPWHDGGAGCDFYGKPRFG